MVKRGIRIDKEVEPVKKRMFNKLKNGKDEKRITYNFVASRDFHFSSDRIDAGLNELLKKNENNVMVGYANLFFWDRPVSGEHQRPHILSVAYDKGFKNVRVANLFDFFPTKEIAQHGPIYKSDIAAKPLLGTGIAEKVFISIIDDVLDEDVDLLHWQTSKKDFHRFLGRHGVKPYHSGLDANIKAKRLKYYALDRSQMLALKASLERSLKTKGLIENQK